MINLRDEAVRQANGGQWDGVTYCLAVALIYSLTVRLSFIHFNEGYFFLPHDYPNLPRLCSP